MQNDIQDLNTKLQKNLVAECKSREACKNQVAELKAKVEDHEDQDKSHKEDVLKLNGRISSQVEQIEDYVARIAILENALQTQAIVHGTPAPGAENATQVIPFSPANAAMLTKALPDPPTFKDGIDPKFVNWQFLMEMKFIQDSEDFNTPASRMAYLITCTSGEVQDQLLTRLRSKVLAPVLDVKEAFEYLEMLYRDPELRTADVHDFRSPWERNASFWNLYRIFVWNAVKHELPEDEWSQNLYEYLQLKLDMSVGEFFTYEEGTPKELGRRRARLCKLGEREREGTHTGARHLVIGIMIRYPV